MLVPTLVAAVVAVALAGVGTASATVLCPTSTAPCSAMYSTGSKVSTSLLIESSITWTTWEGLTIGTCTSGTVSFTTTNTGSATETSLGAIEGEGLSWGGCSGTTLTIERGKTELHWISGTANGTITATGMRVTVKAFLYGTCEFTSGENLHLGKFTGGSTPTIEVEAWMTTVSGSCPSPTRWKGTYLVTNPTPIYVLES